MHDNDAPGTPLGRSLMAAALALPALLPAQAQTPPEQGQVSFKFLDYLDSQPGRDRVRVRAPALSVLAPVAGHWALGATYVSDSISGASPAFHTQALSKLHDLRRALDLSATHYGDGSSWTLGGSFSTEADYVSRGLSLQTSRWTEDKNRTWTFGIGVNSDSIDPSNHRVDHETKRVVELLAGLTQVVGTHDIAQLNLGYSRGRGYFSDPYKVFDNRPSEHDRKTLLARWNHHIEASDGTLRWSYRFHTDNYGVDAHTLGLEYAQPLGAGFSVMPLLRLYTQGAARFYVDANLSGSPFPPNPPAGALYSSEDQRLSAFGARTVGIKLARQWDSGWQADIKLEHYEQRGAWRLFGTGSAGLAPFRARSLQVGVAHPF